MDNAAGIDQETVDDALDVLQDIVLWELTPQRWAQVEVILGRLAAAWGGGDVAEMRSAVADLELSGPVRALRIGSDTVQGISEPVLDRRNTLVHSLGATDSRGPDARPGDARDGDRGGRPTR